MYDVTVMLASMASAVLVASYALGEMVSSLTAVMRMAFVCVAGFVALMFLPRMLSMTTAFGMIVVRRFSTILFVVTFGFGIAYMWDAHFRPAWQIEADRVVHSGTAADRTLLGCLLNNAAHWSNYDIPCVAGRYELSEKYYVTVKEMARGMFSSSMHYTIMERHDPLSVPWYYALRMVPHAIPLLMASFMWYCVKYRHVVFAELNDAEQWPLELDLRITHGIVSLAFHGARRWRLIEDANLHRIAN